MTFAACSDRTPMPDSHEAVRALATDWIAKPIPAYASRDAYCAMYRSRPERRDQPDVRCGDPLVGPALAIPSAWGVASASYFETSDAVVVECNLAFAVGSRVVVLEHLGTPPCRAPVRSIPERARDGGLVVLTFTTNSGYVRVDPADRIRREGSVSEDMIVVCRTAEPAELACTAPVMIGHEIDERQLSGAPGEDGFEYAHSDWSLAWQLVGDQVLLTRLGGDLEVAATRSIGAHRVRLQSPAVGHR
ncbi:MAG: hypothetical protein ABI704_08415 [Kofleriaceae bacterium]